MELSYNKTGINRKGIIVFIHGAGLPSWSWKKQIEFFKEDYLCITIDLPDHGNSRNIHFLSINDTADKVIDTLNIIVPHETINIIGHSLGAKVITYIIAKNKLKLFKSVICSALFHDSVVLKIMNNKKIIKWSIDLIKNNPKLRKAQIKAFDFNDLDMEKLMNLEYDNLDTEAYQRYMNAFSSAMEIPQELQNINGNNILILIGENEMNVMKKSSKELSKRIKNSKIHILKKSNHLYPINKANEFNTIINNWLCN